MKNNKKTQAVFETVKLKMWATISPFHFCSVINHLSDAKASGSIQ